MAGRASTGAPGGGAWSAGRALSRAAGRSPPPQPSIKATATAAAGFPYRAIIRRPFPAPGVPGMLRCESLTQTYLSGGRPLTVLNDITFTLERGGFLAIVGPSGSGKTTLLGLLAGLDRPTAGRIQLDGQDLGSMSEDERALVRAEKVGFVFQSFHLIPTLTARENVQVPLELRGDPAEARAQDFLARVGLGDRS